VECKWGDSGLEEIIQDGSIDAVAIVLAGQNQVSYFLFSVLIFTFSHSRSLCVCIAIQVIISCLASN